jgi:NADPH:quinone reductase-like Zn-dependent oxidoreductase
VEDPSIGLKPVALFCCSLQLKLEAIHMRSIIVREYGEPEVMKVEEAQAPQPSGLQVLVRIEAAGVNPVDTYLRTGIHAHAPKLPYTPGKDGAGVVEAVRFRSSGRVTAFTRPIR